MVDIIRVAYKRSSLSKIIHEHARLLGVHSSIYFSCQLAKYMVEVLEVRTLMTVRTAFAETTEKVAS